MWRTFSVWKRQVKVSLASLYHVMFHCCTHGTGPDARRQLLTCIEQCQYSTAVQQYNSSSTCRGNTDAHTLQQQWLVRNSPQEAPHQDLALPLLPIALYLFKQRPTQEEGIKRRITARHRASGDSDKYGHNRERGGVGEERGEGGTATDIRSAGVTETSESLGARTSGGEPKQRTGRKQHTAASAARFQQSAGTRFVVRFQRRGKATVPTAANKAGAGASHARALLVGCLCWILLP